MGGMLLYNSFLFFYSQPSPLKRSKCACTHEWSREFDPTSLLNISQFESLIICRSTLLNYTKFRIGVSLIVRSLARTSWLLLLLSPTLTQN